MIGQARTRPLQFSTDQLVSDRVRASFRTGREREREQRYSRSRNVIALWLRTVMALFCSDDASIREKSRASASADQSSRDIFASSGRHLLVIVFRHWESSSVHVIRQDWSRLLPMIINATRSNISLLESSVELIRCVNLRTCEEDSRESHPINRIVLMNFEHVGDWRDRDVAIK